jgi:hypothetical protein
MADRIRAVDYFHVVVHDRPGEGYWIYSRLKQSGLRLLACCGFPAGQGRAQLDLVPEDPRALLDWARQFEVTLSPRKRAFLVQGPDGIGAVSDVYEKLEHRGINVVAAQAVSGDEGRWGMILWVKPADFDRAAKALGL